jgi:L-ribulose-5-phosphate 4-epimerase
MSQHGVFTIGKDAKSALKAAIMCEDVAKSAHLARQLGTPKRLPQESIDRLFNRYQNVYGQ